MLDNIEWQSNYLTNPVGIRNLSGWRYWCVKCWSSNIYSSVARAFTFCRCKRCGFEWDFGLCWSCQSNQVDSRDPATPACKCGWYKCNRCGSCNLGGCKTNSYSRRYRQVNEIEVTEYDETSQYSVCECCGDLGIYRLERNGFFCQDCDSVLLECITGSDKGKSEGPIASIVGDGGRAGTLVSASDMNDPYDPVSTLYYVYERILEVEFLSGAVYEYYNVPEQVYVQLLNASLYSSFFENYIRTKYEDRRVR